MSADQNPPAGTPRAGPPCDEISPAEAIPDADDLGAAVLAVAVLSRSLERALTGLTLPQFRILALIETQPQRAAGLADRSEVTRASLSSIVTVLERRGLIRREQVLGDRRGVLFGLTDAGTAELERSRQLLNERLHAFLTRFGPQDRRAVLDGLALIIDSTGRGFSAAATHAALRAQHQVREQHVPPTPEPDPQGWADSAREP